MEHKNPSHNRNDKGQESTLRDSEVELKSHSAWFEPCTSPTCKENDSRRVPPPGSKDSLFRPAEDAAPPRGPDGPPQGISKAIREGALGLQPDGEIKDNER